jgi:hypothetical protein
MIIVRRDRQINPRGQYEEKKARDKQKRKLLKELKMEEDGQTRLDTVEREG